MARATRASRVRAIEGGQAGCCVPPTRTAGRLRGRVLRLAGLLLALGVIMPLPVLAVSPDGSRPDLPGLAPAADSAPDDPLFHFAADRSGPAPAERVRVQLDRLRAPRPEDHAILGGFQDRRIKVIHYARPLRVNQNEMVLSLDAPGSGRAIVSIELSF